MTDRFVQGVRAPLRFWAIMDVVYAFALAALLVVFVPWKWPLAHGIALTYLTLHAVSAPGLWRAARWAWRLAVGMSVAGLLLAIAVVGGLLGSWAYLKGVYGSFGTGASLVSLLMAATAFQALGLYSALRLRSLLRRPVRSHMRGGRAAAAAIGLGLGLMAGHATGIYNHHRLPQKPGLAAESARAALAWLRANLQGETLAVPSEGPERVEAWVSLFVQGRLLARAHAQRPTWADTLSELRAQLAPAVDRESLAAGRLKLDIALGAAPMPATLGFAEAIGFEPGRDGVRQRKGTRAVLPDDMIAADVYGTTPLLPFLDEVRLGVAPAWLRQRLEAPAEAALERFAVQSFIECGSPRGRVCQVNRGVVDLAPLATKQAALYAGQFMLRQQKPDGTFTYVYQPWQNVDQASGYNFARHAGTAYTLALLTPLSPEQGFAGGALDALQWLMNQSAPVCGGQLCVREGNTAKVGSNALTLLALATYQQRTGDTRWAGTTRSLAEFLLSLQKPSGDLVPSYLIEQQRAAHEMPLQMFASEEAAFAWARVARVLGDARFATASARALAFLTKDKYRDFLGRFTYGADSWTCMAAAELPRSLVQTAWVDFCLGYADFLRRLQFAAGQGDPAFEGHYGFTHVLVPQAPAAAGFAEALTATLQLAREHGRPSAGLEGHVRAALAALKRDQLRPGNDYLAQAPVQAWGGIRRSVVQSEIRIDFVQHAAAALAHGHQLGL